MTQQPNKITLYKNAFAISWVIVCIMVFIFYPARLSIVHGSSIENLSIFALKISKIQPFAYAGNLLLSFLQILLFSLACIIGGILPISKALSHISPDLKQSPPMLPAIIGSSFLMGHWLFSTAFLFLAIYQMLHAWVIVIILLIGCSFGINPAIKVISLFKNSGELKPNYIVEKKHQVLYWLSITILFTSLLYSTSRLSYDSVALYFSDAKIIALTEHFQFFQGNSFVLSSLQTGIQFSAIIQLFGDQTARMFSWASGCIVILFGLAIAEKVGISNRAKGILLSLTMTSTAFTDLLGDGKVDLTSSAIALATAYWLLDRENKAQQILAGFFAGLAMVSRPYNIFLLSVFIGSFYLGKIFYDKKLNKAFSLSSYTLSIFWIILGSAIPLTVHLAENWLVYGAPLAMLTDARNMTTENWQWSFDPQYIWLMKSLYPFVMTFLNTPQSIGNISPIFLSFLPYILISDIRKKIILSRTMIELLTAAFITLLLWIILFFTTMEIRYIFFLWIIFFIVMSEIIITTMDTIGNKLRNLLSALLIVLLVFSIMRTVYFSVTTYSPLDAQGNPQCTDFILCDYLKPINDAANQGERVLSLFAYRYYLRTDLFACSTGMNEYHALREASLHSPDEFWEEVYRQGYTYIAYEKNYSIRHLFITFIPNPANTPIWMKLEPIHEVSGENVIAYNINVLQPPFPTTKICSKNKDGIWEVIESISKQ